MAMEEKQTEAWPKWEVIKTVLVTDESRLKTISYQICEKRLKIFPKSSYFPI
jgi:hypothetical protein